MENKKREPKKIKMPPLVDRSMWYDTMSWCELTNKLDKTNEDYSENNSQSISKLESDSID